MALKDETKNQYEDLTAGTDVPADGDFSLEEIENSSTWYLVAHTFDLHHDARMNQGNIMTEYEEKFSSLGNPICKLIAARKIS